MQVQKAAMANPYFTTATLKFLSDLENNNKREWFQENKQAYEDLVRGPSLAFIEDIAPRLQLISPRFLAIPKKMGGSLKRIYRDVRFSKNKTPYKTNIGIQFLHEAGKDAHSPCYYLHIENGHFFLGAGIWRPDSTALGKIRDAIVEKGEKWVAARDDKHFKSSFALGGESLKNGPRGYPKDHPLLEDLKRKDFIAINEITRKDVLSSSFMDEAITQFQNAEEYMRFLCAALGIRFD